MCYYVRLYKCMYVLLCKIIYKCMYVLLCKIIYKCMYVLLTIGAHARSEGYCSCRSHVCVCVCMCVCVSVRSFLPPRASRPRNIGTYVFTATRKNVYNRDFR